MLIIKKYLTCSGIFAIFLLSVSGKSMDLQTELTEVNEYSPLIAPQLFIVPDTSFLLPLGPDVWLKIAIKLDNTRDLVGLSLSSKRLYGIIFNNKILKSKIDLSYINYRFSDFNNNYSGIILGESKEFVLPEKEERDIQSMAALKRKQEAILSFINNQKNSAINLYESSYFEHLYETTHTTDEIIKDMLPLLLDHSADQNPSLWSLCYSSKMSDDLAYLAGGIQHNLVTRLLSLKRVVKIIGKNIPIIIAGTTLFVGGFGIGAYMLYHQYPAGVFDAFMAKNTTIYNWNGYQHIMEDYFSVPCPRTIYEDFGDNHAYFGACTGGGPMLAGNITDWIHFMYSKTGCSAERLSQQLAAVMNATKPLKGPMICLPKDNSTLCCLRAHQWNSGTSLSVDMLIGNAQEAQGAAEYAWRRDMGLYCGFVGPFSLTFIWMLLLSHFCL